MSIAALPRSDPRSLGFTLAFLALWLKLAVPLGFMPVASANGPIFGICASATAQTGNKNGAPEDPAPKAGAECVFSLLHLSALAAPDLAAPGEPLGNVVPSEPSPRADSAPCHGLFAPLPPSHAPPIPAI